MKLTQLEKPTICVERGEGELGFKTVEFYLLVIRKLYSIANKFCCKATQSLLMESHCFSVLTLALLDP